MSPDWYMHPTQRYCILTGWTLPPWHTPVTVRYIEDVIVGKWLFVIMICPFPLFILRSFNTMDYKRWLRAGPHLRSRTGIDVELATLEPSFRSMRLVAPVQFIKILTHFIQAFDHDL